MSVRSYAQVAASLSTANIQPNRSVEFKNCSRGDSAPQMELSREICSLFIRLHSNSVKSEVELLRSQLFAHFFRWPNDKLVDSLCYFREIKFLTPENLGLREQVQECLKRGSFSCLPPLISPLLAKQRFSESLAIANIMEVGADKDIVLRSISLEFARQGNLLQSSIRLKEMSDVALSFLTASDVVEIFALSSRLTDAYKLMDVLPKEKKIPLLRNLVRILSQQGKLLQAQSLAAKIDCIYEREEAFLEIDEMKSQALLRWKASCLCLQRTCLKIQAFFQRFSL